MDSVSVLPVPTPAQQRALYAECGPNPPSGNQVLEQENDAMYAYTGNRYREYNEIVWNYLTPAAKNGLVLTEPFSAVHESREDIKRDEYSSYWHVLALNSMINRRRPGFPITVYRGVSDFAFKRKTGMTAPERIGPRTTRPPVPIYSNVQLDYYNSLFEPGNIIPLYGFLSTTISPSYAIAIATDGTNHPGQSLVHGGEFHSSGYLLQFDLSADFPMVYTIARNEYECILPFAKTFRYNNNLQFPRWLVKKRDTIRVRWRMPSEEVEGKINTTRQPTYVTIKRIVLTLARDTAIKPIVWSTDKW